MSTGNSITSNHIINISICLVVGLCLLYLHITALRKVVVNSRKHSPKSLLWTVLSLMSLAGAIYAAVLAVLITIA